MQPGGVLLLLRQQKAFIPNAVIIRAGTALHVPEHARTSVGQQACNCIAISFTTS